MNLKEAYMKNPPRKIRNPVLDLWILVRCQSMPKRPKTSIPYMTSWNTGFLLTRYTTVVKIA